MRNIEHINFIAAVKHKMTTIPLLSLKDVFRVPSSGMRKPSCMILGIYRIRQTVCMLNKMKYALLSNSLEKKNHEQA